jgi:hypothetical protein
LNYFFFLFTAIVFFSCEIPEGRKTKTAEKNIPPAFKDTAEKHDPSLVNNFIGTIRSDVKTSYVNSVADTFESVKKLRNWLPDDEYMHKSTEARHNNSPRTKEENHNVFLKDVWIFGVKREDDNDFHLIIGSSKSPDKEQSFFTAEISGLPDSSSEYFSLLSAARNTVQDYFGEDAQKEIIFVASKKHPPIHLDYICGSLFFDNHHYGGHSKIENYKVCSAWEIHPVTKVKFH